MAVSPDNAIMALAEDYLSRRQYGLRFRNLESGNWYPEMLDNVSPDFIWANDSETVYYIKKHGTTLHPFQVWRHTVGTASTSDELVYEEKDETFYVSLHKTTSKHYVIIFPRQRHHDRGAATGCRAAGRPAAVLYAAP
ncbi:Protease 2 [Leclercia adecarboxylata]|uniref:Protease 2 n=1 Tax=Leclercia adecarboxylata TaxID=83655 RepID=A0A4U9HYJ1_9ENTR|nr:Protease 2 [Leclercia adecarboxylata]